MSFHSPVSSPSTSTSPSFPSEQHSRRSSTPWSTYSSPSIKSGFDFTEDQDTIASYLFDLPCQQKISAPTKPSLSPYLPPGWQAVGDFDSSPWVCSEFGPSPLITSGGIAPQQTFTMYRPPTQPAYEATSTHSSDPASPLENTAEEPLFTLAHQQSQDQARRTRSTKVEQKTPVTQFSDGRFPPPIYHLVPKYAPHPAYVAGLELKAPPPGINEKLKGPWQKCEDETLVFWAIRLGTLRWVDVAAQVSSRSGKQCRERWTNQLSPDIDHSPFRPEEDALIIRMQAAMEGNRWREVAKFLPGRPENTIKNRFNSTAVQRKRVEMQVDGIPPIALPLLAGQKRLRSEEQDDSAKKARASGKKGRKTSMALTIVPPEHTFPDIASASDRSSTTISNTPATPGYGQLSNVMAMTHWPTSSWENATQPPSHLTALPYDYQQFPGYQRQGNKGGLPLMSPSPRLHYSAEYGVTGGVGHYPYVQFPSADYIPPESIDAQVMYRDCSHPYPHTPHSNPSSSNESYYTAPLTDSFDSFQLRGPLPTPMQPHEGRASAFQPAIYRTEQQHAGQDSKEDVRLISPLPRWAPLASSFSNSAEIVASGEHTIPLIGLGISTTSLGSSSSSSLFASQNLEHDDVNDDVNDD